MKAENCKPGGHTMSRACRVLLAMAALVSAALPLSAQAAAGWTAAQIGQLRQWARAASDDGLPVPDMAPLDQAEAGGNPDAVNQAASELAVHLARQHLLGHVAPARRGSWHIMDSDAAGDLPARLDAALAANGLEAFFSGLAPTHPDYAALRRALAVEGDAARRATIARNMERWRWMPQSLGANHILVNAASFEARLWRGGAEAGRWAVIVGKPSTPTPVFSAMVRGVIINPWWSVPASIVREKRGVFPASQGYVRRGGQVQQRPGPNNALGVVKLDMPNPYSVYLHDTPSKHLFARAVRAFSHGCVRVNDAPGLAAALLQPGTARSRIDAIIATRRTTTIPLEAPLPVYIAYFTAEPDRHGQLVVHPDVYGRDGGLVAAAGGRLCGV